VTIVYFDYVQRSCSSLYRLPRFINCPTYITLQYWTLFVLLVNVVDLMAPRQTASATSEIMAIQ